MKKLLLNIFTDDKMIKNKISFSVILLILLFSVNIKAQHFESVTITGVASGDGSQNALFIVTCPTVPSLTRMRVEKVSGAGTVVIARQTAPAARTDNFTYLHNTGFTSGIPNNVSRMKITFLQADGVTPIPANDFRLVIDDIDGPNNEGIYTDCGSSVRYTATAIPTDLTVNTTPPNLGAVGTANENSGAPSRVMFEYNDVSSIFYTIYANNGFVKEFDLNYDDFTITAPRYAVCTGDNDGDGVSDNLDMDDDNDGILDTVECGGNNPNGDHDGDGLPNYLDTVDNTGQNAVYIANADGSVTNYTDADGDGVPDVYDSSADSDSLPNHLDLDSDGDGCYDAVEGDENVTPTQLLGTGTINIASNGGVGTTVNVNNGVPNLVNSGGAADIGADVGQGIGNSLNASLKDPLCYNLTLTSDSGATATGTAGVAFTVPNVLTNDTLDGVTPVIGSNPGQVAVSQSGVWPAGISLNTTTGQVNVGSSVPAGTYNVTYQVCVNGTSPVLCNTTTVTIVLKADSDGDGITNDIDLDDDNDGILDVNELSTSNLTGTPTELNNFETSGFTSNVGTCAVNFSSNNPLPAQITYSSFVTPVNFITLINNDLGASYSVPQVLSFSSTPPNTASTITEINAAITPNTLSEFNLYINDTEYTTFVIQAFDASNNLLSTTGWNVRTYNETGTTTSSVYSAPIINSNNVVLLPPNAVVTNDVYRVRISENTLSSASRIVISAHRGNTTSGFNDGVIFAFVTSCKIDSDADGIPNNLDTDSDNDGCPDAIEGGANITSSQVTSGHINGTVNANGVPTAVSGGQTIGNSINAALKDPACYTLILTNNTASGSAGTAFNTANVLGNDTLDGVAPVIGTNPGQVAISQFGGWPSGITLNADGTVNVASTVSSGTYNLTYQVCVNGTSPALCSTTTVAITVTANDTDGDGLADDVDLDDDNDGILDAIENNCAAQVTLTNTNTNFSTLLAAGTVTVGGVNITATKTGTVNSFNGDAYIGAGAQINPGFSGTYTNAGGTSFNTPVTSASLTLNFSQPISTFTASFKAMQDEEQITFSQPASSVVNLMNSTYGVAPSIMSLATLVNGGLELRSNLSGIVNSNTSSSFGSNSVVTWYFPVPVSSLTINHTGVNRGTGVGLTNYNGSIIGGDFTFAKSVTCTPLDTDGDGIINSLDTDADGDGCPDAIEGAANITNSQVTSGHINGAVDANGVPTAVSGGQAIGQSQDAAKNDCSDVDADGVPDWQDLDDDNDGILDTVEAPCTSTQAQWSHNASGGQSDFVTFENDTTTTSPNFTSGANITFGAGLDEATDNYSYTYLLRGASTTNFADAKTANDYAQVSYTPSKKMTLKSLNFGYYSNSATDPEFNCGNFRMAVEYSTNPSFTSPILLLNDVQVGAMIAGGYVSINNAINNLVLQSGNTYYFRIYLYNEQNADANNRVRVDDVFFNHCLFVDTDGDGISDDLDTDADGDGCPDAIEGVGNITSSQVTAGHINGGVDANGVPTVVSGGQGIGQSQDSAKNDCSDVDADGVPDWRDLDDDNDGILDSNEIVCSVPQNILVPAYNTPPLNQTFVNGTVVTGAVVESTLGGEVAGNPAEPDYIRVGANSGGTVKYRYTFSKPVKVIVTRTIAGPSYMGNDETHTFFATGGLTLTDGGLPTFNVVNKYSNSIEVISTASNGGSDPLDFNFNISTNEYVTTFDYKYTNLAAYGNYTKIKISILCESLDTDNDGIPDYLDTDSDGDGCPDAIEGAANITNSQVTSGHINGGVDANGVPTTVSGGQGIGNSINAALKDPACYTLTLTNNMASGTSGTAFNIPTVLGNDTLDGITPVIGTNPGQVAISQTGVWPAGITLNPDGTVSVGAGVPAGNYTVTYQVCVNGTSPALCSTTTVIIDLAQGCQAGNVSPVLHKN